MRTREELPHFRLPHLRGKLLLCLPPVVPLEDISGSAQSGLLQLGLEETMGAAALAASALVSQPGSPWRYVTGAYRQTGVGKGERWRPV